MFVDNEIKRTEEEEGGKRTLKDLGEIEGCVYSSTWERNETATWKFSEAITHL